MCHRGPSAVFDARPLIVAACGMLGLYGGCGLQVPEVIRCLANTIIFNRAFGPLVPLEVRTPVLSAPPLPLPPTPSSSFTTHTSYAR